MAGYFVDKAQPRDIPQIAAIFTASFTASVLFHCGKLPQPVAMQDVFTLVYQAEPKAAHVIRYGDSGEIAGYCFSPARLSGLWFRAITGGHLLKWLIGWLTGKYGIGLFPIKMLLLNKISFLQSAFTPEHQAQARILSIAVAEAHRAQGLATLLMQKAIEYFHEQKAAKVRLEVRPDNLPAIKVYEKMGFTVCGNTRDPQGDWLIMAKEMEKADV